MVELRFDSFDWDEGNRDKSLKKHGLDASTIEAFFQAGPAITADTRHSGREQRFVAIGQDPAGRWMMVAFTLRARGEERCLRPISARHMHAKEVRRYEEADQD